MAGLADILAGGPLIGPEMQAQIYGQQAADPRVLASSSGPVGQAIGQLTATLGAAPRAMAAAQQLGAAQTAAMGDMGKYLSADDPIQAAAADTGGNPVARWAMLRTTPEQVIAMRKAMAETAMTRAGLPFTEEKGREVTTGGAFGGFPTVGGGATAASAPTAAGQPTPLQGAAPADPLANVPPAGAQRLTWVAGLPPAQQKVLLARLRAQQAVTPAPVGSVTPPTAPAR